MTETNPDAQIIFYDLPSRDPPTAWSLNTWKSRLALNFKGVDYKTQWVEYPDIAPVLKSLNTPPNTNPRLPPYTLPAATFTDGKTILDSLVIAAKLEALVPSPSMRLDNPIIPDVQKAVGRSFTRLFAILSPLGNKILNAPSAEYFKIKDAKDIALHGPDPEGEAAWTAAEGPLKELAELIEGPFVLGREVSYADFVVVGFLCHARRCAGGEVLERILGVDGTGKVRGVWEGVERGGWLGKED